MVGGSLTRGVGLYPIKLVLARAITVLKPLLHRPWTGARKQMN